MPISQELSLPYPESISKFYTKTNSQQIMSDDFDLSLSPAKRSAPTKGRRANKGHAIEDTEDDELFVSSTLKSRPVSGDLFLGK